MVCCSVCLVAQSCPTLCDSMDCSPAKLLCPWGFSRQVYWSGLPCPPPQDLPNLGIKPRSPVLQEDSLPSKPLGKPKNTRVGSLSLLQGTFPIHERNWGLLHCKQILYQLSSEGSRMNEAEIDVFLELSCFFDDPADVGNLISGSCAFSKSSLNIWKFMVHILLKPDLENFEHCFASM